MELKCDQCGIIPYVQFDGYVLEDRLLEGVMIKCYYENGEWKVGLADPDDRAYTDKLNMKQIFKNALSFITDPDGLDIAQCPLCGRDVDPPNVYEKE